MPELPEAETIARQIGKIVRGETLRKFDVLRDDYVEVHSEPPNGKRLVSAERCGKKVIASFSGDIAIVFSLGMSGNVYWRDNGSTREKHTHLVLGFDRGELQVVDARRFGGVFIGNEEDIENYLVDRQGPDVLTVDAAEFSTRFDGRTAPIKPLLLDQRIVAGIGNIYADEALFKAGVHPLTRADKLTADDLKKLYRAVAAVLEHAIELGGSTISTYAQVDGSTGYFQIKHRVYGKAGEPCPECGAVIEKLKIRGRSSYVCPNCQRVG
ncbi:MAG: DNA-formamidopyrimidine glycosylase [bacterium]|nr:DNA-formamidopyrimidine glycosylase [bacterium]